MSVEGLNVLVTGGTGSLGRALVRRLLSGVDGTPASITVLSRDEAKQHAMRLALSGRGPGTDDVAYGQAGQRVRFRVGSVADRDAVVRALQGIDVVVHAAALKQVPTCEYFPSEAVRTNVDGAATLVRAIAELDLPVRTVVGVSTDKACKPVNVMGMTKALQERVLVEGNLAAPQTRFVVARYGNVMGSRGSVLPLFHDQIRRGGPVTLTTEAMTRFCMSLDQAVDTVLAAAVHALAGETFVPRIPAARMVDLVAALIGDRDVPVVATGVRPGEKTHEVLISEEESARTVRAGDHWAIGPLLPELRTDREGEPFGAGEYSSADDLLDLDGVRDLLATHRMRLSDEPFDPRASVDVG
ncbi:polysaccharide biosynthesis protein [Actinomarinicola tropica]|uniref:NAD-dependent epimerase/dehydratase family protein n=1 Tax=Actinomarinicola tropica TaxID=2789776 RepID=A0A5Q2RHK4_9ACTN|nr:polysaccharide biosynthesis protein [Actinomarinicola tropica]QGG96328.1 NAD-dependent epimerase/dehydratase family protein [Actinomarinicola tropica]